MTTPDHYKGLQPVEAMKQWMTEEQYIGFLRGNVIKYIARYDKKDSSIGDLEKASDYLDMLIKELEYQDWENNM